MSSHQQDVRPGGRVLRFCTSSHSRQDWFPPSGVSPWSGPGTPRPAASATAQTKTWSASPQAVVALGHLWVYLPHFRLLSSGLPLHPSGPELFVSPISTHGFLTSWPCSGSFPSPFPLQSLLPHCIRVEDHMLGPHMPPGGKTTALS